MGSACPKGKFSPFLSQLRVGLPQIFGRSIPSLLAFGIPPSFEVGDMPLLCKLFPRNKKVFRESVNDNPLATLS
jgi:hypothetical protein